MIAIVAAAENWAIGKDNQLLFSLPTDMKRFRALTSYMTVVMGRKTLDSFPGGQPLKNRSSILLTSRTEPVAGVTLAHSVEDVLRLTDGLREDEVYVIGGSSIYRQLLPYCSRVLLTRVLASPPADSFFPDLDALPEWVAGEPSEVLEENGLRFQFIDYHRSLAG